MKNERDTAYAIVQRLQQAGHTAFWVGGCVRDFLLGREAHDFDVATSARPPEVEALFSRTLPVGRQFGVVIVLEAGHEIQVATFRAEADYADGRHPGTVTFADARADATRRDFTVNGLFYDPVNDRLHDWVGGGADLRARVLRTIGTPEDRFAEDHLRLLRAVRFAAQLDFQIEPATFAAIRTHAPKIKGISVERIREELIKMLRPPHAARGLDLLRESGLLVEILPEIAATIDCGQSPEHHPEGSVFEHIRLMLSLLSPDAPASLPWAVLLHDVAKPVTATRGAGPGGTHFYGHEHAGAVMTVDLMERLRFPGRQIDEVSVCVKNHMRFKDVRLMRKATLRRMLMSPTFALELELFRLDCLGSHHSLELYDWLREEARKLADMPAIQPRLLTGADLQELGMRPGPEMGRLLEEIREMQLQDELKTPDEAREWARRQMAKDPTG
jgi:poly(A) polymerase